MASIERAVAEATPAMLISRMVGAVELVLDAEVIELIHDVIGPVCQAPELLQQLPQGRVPDVGALAVAVAARVVEQALRVEQLHPESPDVGAELGAGRPRLQHPI
jgi:hypothetical protein